jgi:hypothetical protein
MERGKETGRIKNYKIRQENSKTRKGNEETKNERMIQMYNKAKTDKGDKK